MSLFDDFKPEVRKRLEGVFSPNVDDFFVATVEEPYRRCSSSEEFWGTYVGPTLGLFEKFKKHFPLKFKGKYTVLFWKPRVRLKQGNFFLQAGFSEPGTLALKFYWDEKLHVSTVAECDIVHLTDQEYYKKKCREAGIRANVFKKLIVMTGEEEYDEVPIENIHQLRSVIAMRDSVDSEFIPTAGDVEAERRRQTVSLPESRLAGSSSRRKFQDQVSFDPALISPGDKDNASSRPPVIAQASTDESEYSPCLGRKIAKPVNKGPVRQDTGKDLGNNPDLIAKELEETVNLGSNTEGKRASSSKVSEKKGGYPSVDDSVRSASSSKSSDAKAEGYPSVGSSLQSASDSKAVRDDPKVEAPLTKNDDKKPTLPYPSLNKALQGVENSKPISNDLQVEESQLRKDFDKSAGSPEDITPKLFLFYQSGSSEPPQASERLSSEGN